MSWHRTYRPRQINDLHLASVRETLLGLMADGKIPQALLFAGPKGTGKTSASRILAAVLNDDRNAEAVETIYLGGQAGKKPARLVEPDPDSALTKKICAGQSFAVQEIDAASHGLVDDVRALKERASLVPQEGRIAVYILDEVHMMSTAAFNAFLKLLEEPPAHAVFILATTELHKIPATIASRCLLVQFRKATDDELVTTLEKILQQEHIQFQPEQLQRLAVAADGSFRDAVKLLELSIKEKQVDNQRLDQLVGGSAEALLRQLIQAVVDKQPAQIIANIQELRDRQADQNQIHKTLFSLLHQDLVLGYSGGEQSPRYKPAVNQFLIQQLLSAQLQQPTPIAFLALEIALLDIVARAKQREASSVQGTIAHKPAKTLTAQPMAAPQEEDEDEQASVITHLSQSAGVQRSTTPAQPSAETINVVIDDESVANAVVVAQVDMIHHESKTQPSVSLTIDPKQLVEKWQDFVTAVAVKNSGLAALLRSSTPQVTADSRISIGVYYRFHQEQLQQPKFLAILEACCAEIVGEIIPFRFELAAQPNPVAAAAPTEMTLSATPTTAQPAQPNTLATMASEVLL